MQHHPAPPFLVVWHNFLAITETLNIWGEIYGAKNLVLTRKALPINANSRRSAFELTFDSLAQSGNEGIRTSVVVSRQLLFRVGSILVDLELDKDVSSDRVSLTGQMVDSSNPRHPPVGISVVLLEGERRIVRMSSNHNGELQLDFSTRQNLKLRVAVDPQRPVSLPLELFPGKLLNMH